MPIATAKVHFVRELAQNLVLPKMNVQQRGKEQDHLHQGDVIEKTMETRKRTKSLRGKEPKVVPDPERGYVSHHQNPVPDQGLANVGVPNQEAIHLDEEVEDKKAMVMTTMGIVYMLQTLM